MYLPIPLISLTPGRYVCGTLKILVRHTAVESRDFTCTNGFELFEMGSVYKVPLIILIVPIALVWNIYVSSPKWDDKISKRLNEIGVLFFIYHPARRRPPAYKYSIHLLQFCCATCSAKVSRERLKLWIHWHFESYVYTEEIPKIATYKKCLKKISYLKKLQKINERKRYLF